MNNEIIKLVTDFGFPALVSLALAWFIVWSQQQHRIDRAEDRKDRREISLEQTVATKELTNAVNSLDINLRGRQI